MPVPSLASRSVDRTQVERGSRWRVWPTDRPWLAALIFFFLIKQVLLAALLGPFTGHDEVDHFYYIVRLADGDGLGVVGETDLPPSAELYRDYVADFPTNAEVIQPPLYHVVLVPLYWLAPGGAETAMYLLRLVSVVIGAVVIWLSYLIARVLFPHDILVVAGVPLFMALQPQFGFEAAIVNHDILVIALASLVTYLLLLGLRDGLSPGHLTAIGLVTAAGLWTKLSFGLMLPIIGIAIAFCWWPTGDSWRSLVRWWGYAVALPLLLTIPWFTRSFILYDDPTGAQRLRDIPGFGEQAQDWDQMLTSAGFWRQLLEDFWGNYGWRQIPFDPLTFRIVWLLWGIALLGFVPLLLRFAVRRYWHGAASWSALQWRGVVLLTLSTLLFVLGVLYVGTIQFTQARFAFPAMVGFATLTVLGIGGWLPTRARPLALPVLLALMFGINAIVWIRFLLPYYYGPGGSVAP